MKRLAREVSPDIKQIDLDVHRTFRDHVMFRERYNIKYVNFYRDLHSTQKTNSCHILHYVNSMDVYFVIYQAELHHFFLSIIKWCHST